MDTQSVEAVAKEVRKELDSLRERLRVVNVLIAACAQVLDSGTHGNILVSVHESSMSEGLRGVSSQLQNPKPAVS